MENDNIFRFILILGFSVVFPIGMYHRLKAHLASREKLNRRAEGLFILTTLRPIAILSMLGLLAYVINPAWMSWSSVELPIWVRWLGVGLGVMAAALLIVVFRNLGTNITDTVVTRANHTLVTGGPYRWVRHPYYVAFALAVAANSVVTANWFLALTGEAVGAPERLWLERPSKLREGSNAADYLILTTSELVEASRGLADYRRSQGYRTQVVDIEDIMDEFNDGVSSPQAIQAFLSHAYQSWERPPRYVVLVGAGTFDHRDLLGQGDSLVPPLLVGTPFGLVASDNRLAAVDGEDRIPEMAVGRLPVVSAPELQAYLDKIVAYE